MAIVSVSLVTPDLFRTLSADGFGKGRNERKQLEEQTAAWKNACDQNGICTLDLKGDDGKTITVKVKPRVVTFNYGVNDWAQDSIKQYVSSSWGKSEAMNNTAIQQFIGNPRNENEIGGMVGEFYSKCTDPTVREKISILVHQIKQMHNAGLYREPGEDPYRIPARLNLLAHLCGMTPCFNCKSGKDRTGQMDVSTKELAITLEMKKEVSIKTTEDEERKKIISDIGHQSGNFEVQETNTGMCGFKLKSQIALQKIYGDENRFSLYGMSEYVKA